MKVSATVVIWAFCIAAVTTFFNGDDIADYYSRALQGNTTAVIDPLIQRVVSKGLEEDLDFPLDKEVSCIYLFIYLLPTLTLLIHRLTHHAQLYCRSWATMAFA